MNSTETARKLEDLLRREFAPTLFSLEDQSYMHAGHKAAGGGGHFYVELRSKRFNGLSPVARQRLVMESLKPMMDKEIHALSLRCIPEE
ncbi:MAG TPA: BolA family protein [Bdellovibrionota bacterium]